MLQLYNNGVRAMERGTGITITQMKRAPKGAVFVCGNGDVARASRLAKSVDRDDLLIRTQSWLEDGFGKNLRGNDLFVMLDHNVTVPVKIAYLMTEHNYKWEIHHGRDAAVAA